MSRRAKLAVGRHIAPVRFLLFAAVFAGVAGALAALGDGSRTALLMGFDAGALVFLAASLTLLRSDAEQMRGRAVDNDANRAGLLAISVLLSLVVLFAVGTLIASPEKLDRGDIVLIVATLLLAWLFANMVFTLHYAHLYYLQEGGRDRGGLEVPGVKEPGYWDFLYFSFTLGMTFQTSDVTISGAHMRRVALGHCMAAFVFNMGILAFTVNALGGP
ncbi:MULTISPECIES: DUF1345 domain-containing protein [unclassified Sphingopyxis]|uniref:DUF1345 domain-containing protein n=1 Tax=unclassified Sphingopyxis TaxID=2614943 RepID=UPI000731450D|nr:MULTISPECIES: DUF1345 domain-containing protein [unclassified Sphingopyxis]KTE20323.1 hypothetical protein ATE61_19930 [Sphingopyxis sp. H057]KTE48971.1 hypothetical protein ATE64_19880 [Sphingopyxis sp. H073]KTE53267.1 hypothetical protein ATE69_13195 [Sphingopyxis sp. H071]KTE57931.1 hypothetical protein ATE66_17550 [Sphingopyxis sp. H107]KTE61678.1 hypothetical protein ATE65_17915 [Sphingopyxis sp. H100]